MEFSDVVRRRRMVRRYRDEPVDHAVVERIVETALRGPSAGFSQGVRLLVITDAQRRRRIAQLCNEDAYVAKGVEAWLSVAPVHIVVGVRADDYRERYAEPDKASADGAIHDWPVPFWWVDAGAAVMLLLLAAVDEGLGAGVLGIPDHSGLRELTGMPADVAPVCLVTLGHRAAHPGPRGSAARGRKDPAQTIHWEGWGAATR